MADDYDLYLRDRHERVADENQPEQQSAPGVRRYDYLSPGAGDGAPEPQPLRGRPSTGEVPDRGDALPQLSRRPTAAPIALGSIITPRIAVQEDDKCRIAAATVLDEISRQYREGRGMQRYRDLQTSLMDNAMVIVMAGVLTYDKLIEKVQDLEKLIGEHGGLEAEQLDPQERLKDWLNGGDDMEEVVN